MPATVGVPEIRPAALIARPGGRPVADHAYGAVPPVGATVLEYATPTCPFGSVAVATASAALMTTVYVFCAVPVIASFTVTTTEYVPAAVGVPDNVAVDVLNVRPAGRPVADHVFGAVPPVEATVVEYPTPTCPFGSDTVEIASTALIVTA